MSLKQELVSAYNDMLNVKVSLGFSRSNYLSHIPQFIDFCADNYPNTSDITKDMLDKWLLSKNFNSENNRRLAIINIRHFTRYLNAIGRVAYVPSSEYNVKVRRYQPYIFNETELLSLFNSIDSLKSRKDYQKFNPHIILPVVFRLELCCGMRPAEPFNLKMDDVNLKTGELFIRKSKAGKDRHITMSEDMRQLCNTYNSIVDNNRVWFFQYPDGEKIPTHWAQWHFTKAWNNTMLPIRINKPRPYDLRHNFATRTLMRWVDEKRDIMALMPYLSTYMGHVRLEETLYYVHLLPERIMSSPGIKWEMMDEIYYTEEDFYEQD